MNIVHLKDGEEVYELWGGPLYVEADNLHLDDQAELDEFGVVLERLWERQGDDGMFWRRKMILCGVEVTRVHLDKQARAHVQLASGSWLLLDTDGTELSEQAMVFGIYGDPEGIPLMEPRQTWKASGARVISFVRED